jgi:hypothetical protein
MCCFQTMILIHYSQPRATAATECILPFTITIITNPVPYDTTPEHRSYFFRNWVRGGEGRHERPHGSALRSAIANVSSNTPSAQFPSTDLPPHPAAPSCGSAPGSAGRGRARGPWRVNESDSHPALHKPDDDFPPERVSPPAVRSFNSNHLFAESVKSTFNK